LTLGREVAELAPRIPAAVHAFLGRLWDAGHAAYVVGGSLRDVLLDRDPADWDLASDARPDRLVELLPGAVYENAFGTVAVRSGGELYEITTFRSDHDYADFRRPHRVEFGDSIELDLARRDFTVNALAWGARPGEAGGLVDPYDGRADVAARQLRAVGDPITRFEEDALRMVRAVRLAATLDFAIEPGTLAAIRARASLTGHLSGERIAAELVKLLAAERPSVGLRLAEETGLLAIILPELAAQRGVAQAKIPGDDLWDHTCRTVDAAPADQPVVRLAALLHDVGKPSTAADGHFLGHDEVGAEMAERLLARLRFSRSVSARVAHLVRQHMFDFRPGWSDAAVRRFIKRIGAPALEELLALREADDVGSGLPPGASFGDLRDRIEAALAADLVLERGDLAIDGHDLIAELGLPAGPTLGRILDELLERVIAEPALNDRPTLLLLARGLLGDER
jgi:putative nucleotidyltransferase with HDIG domain